MKENQCLQIEMVKATRSWCQKFKLRNTIFILIPNLWLSFILSAAKLGHFLRDIMLLIGMVIFLIYHDLIYSEPDEADFFSDN